MFKKFFNWITSDIIYFTQKIKYAHESQSTVLFVGYVIIFIMSFINLHKMGKARKLKRHSGNLNKI